MRNGNIIARAVVDDTVRNIKVPEYMSGWASRIVKAIIEDIKDNLCEIPAADVRENIKSEWGPDHATALCRNCGSLFPAFLRMENFCPNCGAVMKGK